MHTSHRAPGILHRPKHARTHTPCVDVGVFTGLRLLIVGLYLPSSSSPLIWAAAQQLNLHGMECWALEVLLPLPPAPGEAKLMPFNCKPRFNKHRAKLACGLGMKLS